MESLVERRTFLGLSAAGVAALASGAAFAQSGPGGPSAAVAKLADLLESGYVIPEIGKRYAQMLRAKLAGGGYAAIPDPAQLGDQLTADLRAVSPDNHLRVLPEPALPGGPQRRPAGAPPPMRAPRRASVEDAGWLAKGVAYIRFTGFTGEPMALAAVRDFMAAHASASALIIDCRYNGGGGIDEMGVMLPYLYARETVLAQMEMVDAIAKTRGSPFEGEVGIRDVAGPAGIARKEHFVTPHATEKRLLDAKAFYLVSKGTASAGEHLALAFKHTGRAKLIGETTAGANHFGGFEPLGAGLAVFLPVGRTIDPATGKDWEGTGIAPDIACPPTGAVQEALKQCGVAI